MGIKDKKKMSAGIIFLLLGLIINQWSIGLISSRWKGDSFPIYLWFFQLFMFINGTGIIVIKDRRKFFKFIGIQISVFCTVFVMLIGFEIYLTFSKWAPKKRNVPEIITRYQDIINLKAHPLFISFFDEKALNTKNEVVSIDGRGFRGQGPEMAGKKKLAFISGGSTVFGWYSLSDDTTISSFLNRFQDEYFFVNAGVVSYNSTQEYLKLSFDLVKYKPDLIVFLNGFNDVGMNFTYRFKHKNYVCGTPSIFEKIDDMVNKNEISKYIENRSLKKIFKLRTVKAFLKDLSCGGGKRYADKKSTAVINFDRIDIPESDAGRKNPVSEEIPADVAESAESYIENTKLMRTVCEGYNIKVVTIFQPGLCVHRSISEEDKLKFPKVRKEFITHSFQFSSHLNRHAPYIYDFGDIFDKYSRKFPVKDIFYDTCHFTDTGNKIVAGEIIEVLKKENLMDRK